MVGLDTSLPTTSVCVMRSDGATFETPPPEIARLLGPARHSEELLPELARRLAEAEVAWRDIDSIAVGVGPGTFTGLRIGISTARAIGQALDVRIWPVSSLEALAAHLARSELEAGHFLSLIDARRGQVFAALYRRPGKGGEGELHDEAETGDEMEALVGPTVMDPDDLLQLVRRLDQTPLCAGDWALRFRDELRGAGAEIPPSDSGLHAVSALQVCRLADSVRPVRAEEVQPLYLRLPDAEINRRLAQHRDP
jgi:tRNA threonylcarbamoyladenosine biosynthesis protein TsaB